MENGIVLGQLEQIRRERQKNEALLAMINKAVANLQYLAMMTGVDITDEVEENDYEKPEF